MLLSDQLKAKYSIVPLFRNETLRFLNHFDESLMSPLGDFFFKFIPKPAIWKKEL
jgi:hypothetical protein